MATRISQEQLNKFISPEAAMAPFDRMQKDKQQRVTGEQNMAQQSADADARLAQLIKGDELKQQSIDANVMRAQQQAAANGMERGKFSVNANEGGFSVNPESDPFAKQLAQGLRQANITGYDIADPSRVLPTTKDAEEVKKSTGNLKALQNTGIATQQSLNDAGPLDRFGAVKIPFTEKQIGTSKGIALESNLTDMKLQLKELANLGALSGPDMSLIESAMGNVTGLGSLIGGKERGMQQLNEILNRAKSRVKDQATSRGYRPQQGYLESPQQAPSPAAVDPGFAEWKRSKGLK
jgi:hypothetical protein